MNHFSRQTFSAVSAFAVAAGASLPTISEACSSCGCSVGTEWADVGYSAAPGLRVGLRYDFINQNELRHDSHTASATDISNALADGSVEETQTDTLTRFYTASLDYGFNRDWAVNVQLPYLDRSHGTIADGDTDVSTSSRTGIGDIRIVGRYQGIFADRSLGVQFGIKLPTGGFHQNFSGGPGAGTPLDRGLQMGTGTTDLIAGVYHFSAFSRDWDHFEQLQIKVPVNTREDFRPSTQLGANFGVRYMGIQKFVPQLQLNVKYEGKESGDQADRPNSGSTELYVSPGATFNVTKPLSVYGFVQLPIYRDYNGLQLAPHYSATAGLSYSF